MNLYVTIMSSSSDWFSYANTDLTDYYVEKSPDAIESAYPSVADVKVQKLKDPGEDSSEKVRSIIRSVIGNLDKSDGTLDGVGPLERSVSWPVTPGDLVWAGAVQGSWNDGLRHFGVYIGGGYVVDFGLAKRHPRMCRWIQAPQDSQQRVALLKAMEFTGNASMRCGVYNERSGMDRMETLEFAAAAVGTRIARLSRPDAQHFAVYIVHGIWSCRHPSFCSIHPAEISGTFKRGAVEWPEPGFGVGKSACKVSINQHVVKMSTGSLDVSYDISDFARELARQRTCVQPYHDFLTGAPLSEDDVATILAESVESV